MTIRNVAGIALASLLASSCIFEDIAAYEESAPIEAVDRPADFSETSGFGRIVDGYRGTLSGGVEVGRFVASAGAGSGHVVFGLWDGSEARGREPIFDGCEDIANCDAGVGTDVIGIPLWNGLRDCVMTSSATERTLRVQCESDPDVARLGVSDTEGFGRSLAALPEGSQAGVAIVGAPEAAFAAETGELWKVISGDIAARQLEVASDAALAPGAELGAKVAAAPMPDGSVMIAAAAPGMDRVLAFHLNDDPTDLTLETLGCVDGTRVRPPGTAVEAGGALALGDVDGDGLPDLMIGTPSANRVRVFSGSGLTGAIGCASAGQEDDPSAAGIDCGDVSAPSVESCGAFGAALAVGDVNGDGAGDLVVGAPESQAEGRANAGAVYTIPGGSGGLDAAAGAGLALTDPAEGQLLGEALTTAPSQVEGAIRDEVVAAAPGDSRLFVFWCTGVAGDDAAEGRGRCLDGP